MEPGLLDTLDQLVHSHPGWLVGAAFAFAFLESLAIVGIVVPGIVLLFMVGAVLGLEPGLLWVCWLAASSGALAGDGVSYCLGWRFRHRIPGLWPLSRRPDMIAAGQAMFERHGGKGVLIGRFVGPIRPVVPLLAGMMHLRPGLFFAYAIPACLLWAPLYLLPGMLFGASLEMAAELTGRLALVILVVVMGGWLIFWLTRVVYEFTARRSGWWLRSLIQWSRAHPLLGSLVSPLFEPGRREVLSVALLGLLLIASLAVLLVALLTAPLGQSDWDAERQLAGWAASMRNPYTDPLFVVLALAGDLRVMGGVAAVTGLLLIALRRANAAWHWLAATAGCWLAAVILSAVMGLVLPAPEAAPSLAEVPHRAFALATAVMGFFAVMLAKDLSPRRRKWPYLATSLFLGLVGFANFYLGLASTSGLLAGAALGMGWVALVGIAFRQRASQRPGALLLAFGFYSLFAVLAMGHAIIGYDARLDDASLERLERQASPAASAAPGGLPPEGYLPYVSSSPESASSSTN